MRRRRSAAFLAVAVLLPAAAAAHDNLVVHRRLGELSVQQLGNPFFFPYSAEVREGSYGEDVPATRSLGHFYNPETDSAPWFALGSGPAWQNAQTQFDEAVGQYVAGNYTGEDAAFYRMGRALHFIQDMTSVAHVHDDQHATDDEDFEDYGPSHVDDYDYTAVAPKYAAVPTAEGFVKEIARLVYDLTSYQAVLDAFDGCPSQCQQNSQLRTMFPSLHYEDGGFFDGDVWEIDRIGLTDTFLGASDAWWITEESKVTDNGGRGGSSRIRGDAYIENTAGNSAQPVPVVFAGQPNSANETLLQLYARLLYPEAIAYGAGLLQTFANSVGGPPPPTATATATRTATRTFTAGPPPTATSTPLVPPSPTVSPTSTATPTPSGPICAPLPRLDCRTAPAGKSVLVLRNKPGGDRDALIWKWTRGDASLFELGNPTIGAGYGLCLYDESGGIPNLVLEAKAPAGVACPTGPCWRSTVGGFRYDDRTAANEGLRSIVMRGGDPGKGRLLVKAKGANLAMPAPAGAGLLAQSPRVRVQFVAHGALCWEGIYGAPAIRNSSDLFRDRSD